MDHGAYLPIMLSAAVECDEPQLTLAALEPGLLGGVRICQVNCQASALIVNVALGT